MVINKNLSNTLNQLRWFAAFLVVIEHLRSLLFINYSQLIDKTLINQLFYFATNFGHEAVIVFFVLSGFLVGGEFIRSEKDASNIKKYFIKRFSRIYIVFFPSLIIGFLFDFVGSSYFNHSLLYNNEFNLSAMNYDVVERLTFTNFISNTFMMQTSLTDTLGSNGPLWSLSNEWWYYMLLPLIFFTFFYKNLKVNFIAIITIIILIIVLKSNIFFYFLIWLMGLAIYKFSYKIKLPYIFILSLILVFTSFSASRMKLFDNVFISDFVIALSIIFLINTLIYSKERTIYFEKTNYFFAEFSYTLYLFHFPLLTLITALILNAKIELYSQPTIMHYSLFIILLILTYIFSFFMYLLFEKNTKKLKNKLINWICN